MGSGHSPWRRRKRWVVGRWRPVAAQFHLERAVAPFIGATRCRGVGGTRCCGSPLLRNAHTPPSRGTRLPLLRNGPAVAESTRCRGVLQPRVATSGSRPVCVLSVKSQCRRRRHHVFVSSCIVVLLSRCRSVLLFSFIVPGFTSSRTLVVSSYISIITSSHIRHVVASYLIVLTTLCLIALVPSCRNDISY